MVAVGAGVGVLLAVPPLDALRSPVEGRPLAEHEGAASDRPNEDDEVLSDGEDEVEDEHDVPFG